MEVSKVSSTMDCAMHVKERLLIKRFLLIFILRKCNTKRRESCCQLKELLSAFVVSLQLLWKTS